LEVEVVSLEHPISAYTGRLIREAGWEAVMEAVRNANPAVGELCPTCNGHGTVNPAELAELMERPGVTRIAAHATERVAGTTPSKGTGRYNVLMDLRDRGPSTAHAVGDSIGIAPNQIGTRFGELRDDLFVRYLRDDVRAVVQWPTTPGNTGMVHEITDLGLMALNEAHR
jgi:hypothetical protein